MPKLTPKEAFEHLQAVFPSIVGIRVTGDTLIVLRPDNCSDFVFKSDAANIDWGDATSYKPERWRPATIEDVKRALDEPIECRSQGGRAGMIVGGYLSSTGVLIFNVRMANDVIDLFRNVEVLDA